MKLFRECWMFDRRGLEKTVETSETNLAQRLTAPDFSQHNPCEDVIVYFTSYLEDALKL